MAELLAARRDASFYEHPGRAYVYHVVVVLPSGRPAPGCNQRDDYPRGALLYDLARFLPAEKIPDYQQCRRPGCRVRWPKFTKEAN